MERSQATVARKITFCGKALHTGRITTLEINPAMADTGIVFKRTDSPNTSPIKASYNNISTTVLSTSIGEGRSSISTIEHLMAAFIGLEIDNAFVTLDGPEVPILDGSSQGFVDGLMEVRKVQQNFAGKIMKVSKPFEYRAGDQFISVEPFEGSYFECAIDFPWKVIGKQSIEYNHNLDSFLEIADARTFCHADDVEVMKTKGLALGGSLDNAVVVSEQGVLNGGGLRSGNEFVKHKLLDMIGDLGLLGGPIQGLVKAYKPGHRLHKEFMLAAMENEVFSEVTVSVDKARFFGKISSAFLPVTANYR